MTYEETKKLLKQVRAKRRLCKTIRDELEELERNIRALCLPGIDYERIRVSGGLPSSSVERIVEKLNNKSAAFDKALTEFMESEDRLTEAIEQLPPVERTILTERYLKDIPPKIIANKMHYSIDHIFTLQRSAIQKIKNDIQ